jgi:hypothetical protein
VVKAIGTVRYFDPELKLREWEGSMQLEILDESFIEQIIVVNLAEIHGCRQDQITVCPGTLTYSVLGKS